jgi:hypothetical protein
LKHLKHSFAESPDQQDGRSYRFVGVALLPKFKMQCRLHARDGAADTCFSALYVGPTCFRVIMKHIEAVLVRSLMVMQA